MEPLAGGPLVKKLAGRGGLEPPLRGPEPRVLPLDDLPSPRAVYDGVFGTVKATALSEAVVKPWIEAVAQAVAHDVHGKHRRRQENAGEEDVVGEDAEER